MEGFKEKEVIYQRIVMYLIIECKESKGHWHHNVEKASTHRNRPRVYDFPFLQVPLAELQEKPFLQARLANYTVTADGEFVQVYTAEPTPCVHNSSSGAGKTMQINTGEQIYKIRLAKNLTK